MPPSDGTVPPTCLILRAQAWAASQALGSSLFSRQQQDAGPLPHPVWNFLGGSQWWGGVLVAAASCLPASLCAEAPQADDRAGTHRSRRRQFNFRKDRQTLLGGGTLGRAVPTTDPEGTVGATGARESLRSWVWSCFPGVLHRGGGEGNLRATVPAEARGRQGCRSARGVSIAVLQLHLVRLKFTHGGPWPGEVSALTVPDFKGALPGLVSGPHHKVEPAGDPRAPV